MDKSQPGHEEYDKYIDILVKALKEIRDSSYRPAIILRSIAARALENKRP